MITAVINEKGGVGKTTTTATLGHALSRLGQRVLLVDLDPQSNLTAWIGRREEVPEATVANALADKAALPYAIGPSSAGEAMLAYGSRAVADAADDLRASNPAPALVNPSWVRLERVEHEEFGTQRLALVSRGRSLEVGDLLGPDQKAELANRFSRALALARRGPRLSD